MASQSKTESLEPSSPPKKLLRNFGSPETLAAIAIMFSPMDSESRYFPESETTEDLLNLVQEKERELFPEFQNRNTYIREDRGDELNAYFAPSHHFRKGLIDQETLKRLQNDESLISFGSGKAHLEQLLVKAFGINPDQITLTDKNSVDLPAEIAGYQIDMHGEWPDFGKKFSFAIFPESFTSLLPFKLKEGADKSSQAVEAVSNLISRCFDILNEHGEVRVDGHFLSDDELHLIQKKLSLQEISLTWDRSLLVAKKINTSTANSA